MAVQNTSTAFKLLRKEWGYDLEQCQIRMHNTVFTPNINSANSPYTRYNAPRPSHKRWGVQFAKFLKGPDFDFSNDPDGFSLDWYELRNHLNDAPNGETGRMFHIALNKLDDLPRCYPSDHIALCQHCGNEVHMADDMYYSDHHSTRFGSCCDDSFTWSDLDEDYIHNDNITAYYDCDPRRNCPEGYALERTLRNSGDYLYSEELGEWVCNDLYYEYAESDEYEEDEDEDSSRLRDYHNTPRNFRAYDSKPATLFPPLGVELEVYSGNRSDSVEGLRQVAYNIAPTIGPLILEKDGSLDSYHGFEIVTNPLGRAEWQIAATKILASLANNGANAGTDDVDNQYGIHVNLSRKCCSPLQEARMMMFLCAEENKRFAQVIAQRENVYNGSSYSIGAFPQRNQKVSQIGGLRIRDWRSSKTTGDLPYKKVYGVGKYAPINFKSNPDVAEFRIFRSTIDPVEFLKNIEFVWALYAWTHPSSMSGTSWHYKDFLLWLSANSKQSWQRYPNLLTYLHDETRAERQDSSVPAPINTYLPREKTAQKDLRLAA